MREPTAWIDYTSKDYEAYRTLLIQELQRRMPEYTDTSSTDAGIVILECLANGLDIVSMYNDLVANDVLLHTTQDRRIAVIIARMLHYTVKNQTAAVVPQVFVLNSVRDTNVLIPAGSVVHTVESADAVTVYFETEDSLIIPAGALGNEQDAEGNYLYSVNAVQGSSVTGEVVGTSNGEPFQSFQLGYKQVLQDSITLLVNEGDGWTEWRQVGNFIDSDENSQVYAVTIDDFDNCFIEFGSGIRGRIPTIYGNGIVASYRVGGGVVGNVDAGMVTEYSGSVAFVDSTFNLAPTTLGHERESIDEIRANAPAAFRTQDRAVTEQDYSDLVTVNFYEVWSAAGVSSKTTPLKMDVYYNMRKGYSMTNALLESIKDYLDTRKIGGTTFEMHEQEWYDLPISANLIVDDDYSRATIKGYVEDYVRNTFFAENEFVFGEQYIRVKLEREVMDTFSGVESFRVTSPDSDRITPERNQIIRLSSLTLNVTGGIV